MHLAWRKQDYQDSAYGLKYRVGGQRLASAALTSSGQLSAACHLSQFTVDSTITCSRSMLHSSGAGERGGGCSRDQGDPGRRRGAG